MFLSVLIGVHLVARVKTNKRHYYLQLEFIIHQNQLTLENDY